MANYEQNIVDAIDILVDKAISNAGFNRTIQASIINSPNPDTGEYLVQYQDSTFTAYAVNPTSVYEKGTMVYILIPNNDLTSTTKTILGPVNHNTKAYSAENNIQYEVIGNDLVDKQFIPSFSSYSTIEWLLFGNEKTDDDIVTIDNTNFLTNILVSNKLKISYDVRTTIPAVQQEFGEYGIIITLAYDNDTTIDYSFTSSYFNQNPYTLNNESNQYKIIDSILTTGLIGIKSIKLICKNFNYQEDDASSDIFISNLKLEVVKELSNEEYNNYRLVLSTPGGNTIKSEGEPQVSIKAEIKKKDSVIPQTNCQVFWFREDASITKESERYNAYGGYGWYCLNKIYYTDKDKTDKRWINGDNEYTVYQTDVLCGSVNFKCVVAFENNTYEQEITVYNESPAASINLSSTNGNYFLKNAEDTQIEILISDVNDNDYYSIDENEQNYTYYWLERNSDGIIEDKTFEIFMSEDEEENYGYIKVPTSDIDSYATFICSVYGTVKKWEPFEEKWYLVNNVFLGTSRITIFNTSETSSGNGGLSITNGVQSFKYDSFGVSPYSNKNYSKNSILPLTFTLYIQEEDKLLTGKEILEYGGKVNWLIPTEGTLLTAVEDVELDSYYDNNIYYYNHVNDDEFEFSIADNYDYNNVINNNIKLIVIYKDKYYSAETSFVFSKEGTDNINGNEYNVILDTVVTDAAQSNDYIIYINGEKDDVNSMSDIEFKYNMILGIQNIISKLNSDGENYTTISKLEKIQFLNYIKNQLTSDLYDIGDIIEIAKTCETVELKDETIEKVNAYDDIIYNEDNTNTNIDLNLSETNKWNDVLDDITQLNENYVKPYKQSKIAGYNSGFYFDSNFGITMGGSFISDDDLLLLNSSDDEETIELSEDEDTVTIDDNDEIITDISEYANWLKATLWKDGSEQTNISDVTWTTLDAESALIISNDGFYFNVSKFINEETDDFYFRLKETIFEDDDEEDPEDSYTYIEPIVDGDISLTNIIKAEVVYDTDKTIYGIKPIISSYTHDERFRINIEENSGFRYVQYSMDSISPQYDSSAPFTINLDSIDGTGVDEVLTSLFDIEENYTPPIEDENEEDIDDTEIDNEYYDDVPILNYKFFAIGDNLTIDEENENTCIVTPAKTFLGDKTENAVVCLIYATYEDQTVEIGWIHIPIYMYLDRYGLAFLNGWDGNKVEVEDGYICAPVMGAGQKETDNSFTGVVLGTIVPKDDSEDNVNKVGLMGMSWGNQSFFLNAKDGAAMFGPDKDNGIFINPGYTYNGSTITRGESYLSGNFEAGDGVEYEDDGVTSDGIDHYLHYTYNLHPNTDENGNVISYSKLNNDSDYFAKNGLKIAFYPEPYIVSPNFVIDSDGDAFFQGDIIAKELILNSEESTYEVTSESTINATFTYDTTEQPYQCMTRTVEYKDREYIIILYLSNIYNQLNGINSTNIDTVGWNFDTDSSNISDYVSEFRIMIKSYNYIDSDNNQLMGLFIYDNRLNDVIENYIENFITNTGESVNITGVLQYNYLTVVSNTMTVNYPIITMNNELILSLEYGNIKTSLIQNVSGINLCKFKLNSTTNIIYFTFTGQIISSTQGYGYITILNDEYIPSNPIALNVCESTGLGNAWIDESGLITIRKCTANANFTVSGSWIISS